MQSHKIKVVVRDDHEVTVRLPDAFPAGEAEVIVVATLQKAQVAPDVIDRLLAALPKAPVIPLSAMDRSDLYR